MIGAPVGMRVIRVRAGSCRCAHQSALRSSAALRRTKGGRNCRVQHTGNRGSADCPDPSSRLPIPRGSRLYSGPKASATSSRTPTPLSPTPSAEELAVPPAATRWRSFSAWASSARCCFALRISREARFRRSRLICSAGDRKWHQKVRRQRATREPTQEQVDNSKTGEAEPM